MYRKIIVGYDGSERAQDALARAKLLTDASGAELVVAGVFEFDPRWGGHGPRYRESVAEYARVIEAAAAAVGAEPEAMPSSSIGRGLHELAEETDADLIVVGSSHRSRAGQDRAGNVGQSLLHGSPCSVAVASHGFAGRERPELEELVVGYDGSDESRMAVDDATGLARASGALLKLVTVSEPPPTAYGKSGRNAGWHALKDSVDEMMRECLDGGVASLPEDVAVEGVLAHAIRPRCWRRSPTRKEPCSCSARGTTARSGGCCSAPSPRGLVRTAPCPVVVHPRPAKAKEPAAATIGAGSVE
jgi:nucleotide-binding universal stress UspA family protein